MVSPASRLRSWILPLVFTSVAFLCGAVVGGVGVYLFSWQKNLAEIRQPGFPMARMIQEIRDDFQLNADQTRQIEEALITHRRAMSVIHREVYPRVEREMEALGSRVEALLTPEQARRWTGRFEERKRRWFPPPPGGPNPEEVFRHLDKNSDGKLTGEEALQADPPLGPEHIQKVDKNQDGVLILEEFVQLPPPPPP